jgi:hypothetical protein
MSFQALRPFTAEGPHSALYVVPVFGVFLRLVLFAARGRWRDMEKQHRCVIQPLRGAFESRAGGRR